MWRGLAIAVVLGLTACGGSPPAQEPVAAPAPAARLTLGEMTVTAGASVLEVHADGRLVVKGKHQATVTTDGKLLATNGEPIFQLFPDGRVRDLAYEKTLNVVIGTDGTLTAGKDSFAIDPSGVLTGVAPGTPEIRITGATSTELRRTAMFVLVVVLMAGAKP